MALTAADCAGLHLGFVPHSGAGVYQTRSPLSRRRANMPPPAFGSTSELELYVSEIRPTSDNATYTFESSAADPHWTPPRVPPFPMRVDHNTAPSRSGSTA